MPFETSTNLPRKVAVIGAGISGMGAAHALANDHRVVLFEACPRLGGHARTRMAGPQGDTPVDTGFIVFNYANYPHLTALFDHLSVPVVKSNMSFGASFDGGRLEYALTSLDALFAQRRNLANPRFLRMIRDILHFNKNGLAACQDTDLTIGGLLAKLNLSDYFRDHYLLPFSGAIWSTPKERILDFPAYALLRFFDNHALLGTTGQHQWYTVDGGSIAYVRRLGADLDRRGVDVRLDTPVAGVRRTATGVQIRAKGTEWEDFDEVVFATHSDDTLALLADATPDERSVLGAVRYQANSVILHSDTAIMPQRRKVWASWIYTESHAKRSDQIDLTYWMNSLQPWLGPQDYMVTLNTTRPIREELIWDQTSLRHPVYDTAALQAQDRARLMNGQNRTWFCGAWMKNGFHEDGLSSAYDVVTALNANERLELAAELTPGIDHIAGHTFHARKGGVKNAFRYSIDYVICDAEADLRGPALFGRNRRGLMSLQDRDHGGAIKAGQGAAWVRAVLAAHDIELNGRIDLLAQPRVLGHVFNPVSFWLIHDTAGVLRCVIAEVGNTFGDRHSYLCHTPDLAPITGDLTLAADKIFHVSPFQPIAGGYSFRFDISAEAVDIRIDYTRGEGGLIATLAGPRHPLTNAGILKAILRRPFGSRRVLALIHWQAIKLWWKGATFRRWSKPPKDEVS